MDLMSRFAACPPFTTLSGHHCGSCQCQDGSSNKQDVWQPVHMRWSNAGVPCNGL